MSRALLASILALTACDPSTSKPAPTTASSTAAATASAVAPVDPDDPEACAPCHGAVVAEWKQSMHARAHHSRDPIYAGMRDLRMNREGDEVAGKCAKCHTPRAAEAPKMASSGVSCASCHQVAEIHRDRGPGRDALQWTTTGAMAGPHDLAPDASPAHGTGPAPSFMKDGTDLCLACHDGAKNPQGIATCTTGAEYATAKGPASCVSCHMPEMAKPAGSASTRSSHRSHAFVGPHHAWSHDDASFLASGVTMTATLEGSEVVVTLTNDSPHAFPSGFPGRLAAVVAKAGAWKSAPTSPMKDTPEAVLLKKYVDAEGKPVPAPFAAKLAADTRLKVGETREIRLAGIPAGASAVEVSLLFFLLPPPLAKTLGVAGPEAEPRVVIRTTAKRSE